MTQRSIFLYEQINLGVVNDRVASDYQHVVLPNQHDELGRDVSHCIFTSDQIRQDRMRPDQSSGSVAV